MSSREPWRNPRPAPHLDELRHGVPLSCSILPWLRAWWPPLFWAAIIFFLSTDSFSSTHTSLLLEPFFRWLYPAISPDNLELVHYLVRKSAHFAEYFIFCLLLYHGIRATRRDTWHWSWALIAWLVAAAYSALDEIHQIFVPSRGPSAWDSLLDSTGALFALVALFLLYRLRRRPGAG